MVQLVRNSKLFGILVAAFLWIFGPIINHWIHEDETSGGEVGAAIQEKQRAQIEPPPVFRSVLHDPWSWFGDDSDLLAQQLAQQVSDRLRSNFLIVTNGARRKAMAEFEAVTA